ncbi:hypothetical protein HELRODRAFT_189687 [Helobdella robusta]|uniref:C2H2-type domain-containing protein n=1 Tax=Helobdella robusta TaxID=6412 RepID=T1FR93_HELRO|nr:hypothetical protein HELRODRAFT_189687 [Helobdella robusta]ESN91311.1 hypothetical protein HELRODRAFT_189687 [Helobdella robusta]
MFTIKEEPNDDYFQNSYDSNPLGDVNDPPTVYIDNGIKHEVNISSEESPKDMDLSSKPKTRCHKKSLYRALNFYKIYHTPKKLMKQKTLKLEAIIRLTEKPMIALFSQMSSNELKKSYVYTCCLIPTKCSASFSSYGNENKARKQMYEHLQGHLVELLDKKRADPTFVFMADVVQKNLSLGESSGRKQEEKTKVNKRNCNTFGTTNTSDDNNVAFQMSEIKLEELDSNDSDQDFLGSHNEVNTDNDKSMSSKLYMNVSKTKSLNILKNSRHRPSILSKKTEVPHEAAVHKKFESRDKHVCLIKDHPWCTDHSYDFKHRGSNKDKTDNESHKSKQDTPLHRVNFPVENNLNQLKLILPIVKMLLNDLPDHLGCLPNNVFEVCSDEDDVELPSIKLGKPPPTLLSGPLRNRMNHTGMLATLNTEAYQTVMANDINKEEVERLEAQTTSLSDLEIKRLTTYYLNELRNKKREDSEMSLTCKICRIKQFTHAHAGIKPYVCYRCEKTFTRQHSTCSHTTTSIDSSVNIAIECSDIPEHRRSHTGETPFHCTDCPLKFKTNNTYKRHMRTKHDKIVASSFTSKINNFLKLITITMSFLPVIVIIMKWIPTAMVELVNNESLILTSPNQQAVKKLLSKNYKVIVVAPKINPGVQLISLLKRNQSTKIMLTIAKIL